MVTWQLAAWCTRCALWSSWWYALDGSRSRPGSLRGRALTGCPCSGRRLAYGRRMLRPTSGSSMKRGSPWLLSFATLTKSPAGAACAASAGRPRGWRGASAAVRPRDPLSSPSRPLQRPQRLPQLGHGVDAAEDAAGVRPADSGLERVPLPMASAKGWPAGMITDRDCGGSSSCPACASPRRGRRPPFSSRSR